MLSSLAMVSSLVRRPLFSTAAALAVVGATGAAYLGTEASSGIPGVRTAYLVPAEPLAPEEAASAQAQAGADADDQAGERVLEQQGEAKELLAEQQAAAAAAAAQAEAERVAAEAQRVAQEEAARVAAAEQASRDAARDPRSLGRVLAAERGWGESQFSCLDSLWTKESNWKVTADNPSSSAYGIPQSLPGSKMASHGADWKTNPATQISWGLSYIEGSYGTPCAAWSHSRSHNWY